MDSQERWWRHFEPLWVSGLALLTLLLGHALFRGPFLQLEGKRYDYAQYLVAGTIFPVLLFGVPLVWRWRRLPDSTLRTARRAIAVGALVWFALFVVSSVGKHGVALMVLPPILALAQTVLMWRPWQRNSETPERLVAVAVIAIVAWTVAISFLLETFVQPPVFLVGFIAAFVLACSATWDACRSSFHRSVRVAAPANVIAIAFIAFMSLRTERLFDVLAEHGQGALHHWSPWVGSAELVRQGGWLLWDVPSMYGFLSILPIAAAPSRTPWQSFYLLQSVSFFIVATTVFLTVRGLRPGWLNWCLALTTAVAVPMFFASFDASAPVGSTFIFPNAGAYRYIWCFLLVAILVWELVADDDPRRHRWLLIGGCFVWAVGVLWSPESAFFCSGVWLPAHAVIILRMSAKSLTPYRTAAAGLTLPLAMLAGFVGIVSIVYMAGLGRLPDWVSYLDFVRGLGTEVFVAVNDPTGSALGLLLGYCVLATAAWYAGTRHGAPARSLALFAGMLGGFWATGIYGFTRAYVSLHPIAYVALAVMLVTIAGRSREGEWKTSVRAATAPLLVLILVSPLAAIVSSPSAIGDAIAGVWTTARSGFTVEPLIPGADPELQALMAEAEIGPLDPVSFQGSWLGNLMPPWRSGGDPAAERIVTTRDWLPGHPYVSLRYVPEGRGPTYMRRFVERVQLGGWLVQHKTGHTAKPPDQHEFVYGREPWFFEVLGETHVPTRILENEEWQLVWFDYVGRESDVVRPFYTEYRGLPPLLPDVTIDGQPLADQVDPNVWVLPGAGVGWYDAEAGARWINNRAELWVFSREPRKLTVSLRLLPDAQPIQLLFTAGEQEVSAALKRRRTVDEAPIALRSGWNRIELRLLAQTASDTTSRQDHRDSRTDARRKGESPSPANATSLDGWFVTGIDIRTS